MSYNRCFKKSDFIRKTITVLLMSVVLFTTFSITTFAQETQTVHTEETEIRYVTSSDVNLVFNKYVTDFKDLPDSTTVTKSQLYEAISNSSAENDPEGILPLKIVLELRNHPEDLITENDLIMYIDEFEDRTDNRNQSVFDNAIFLFGTAIVLLLFLMVLIVALKRFPEYPDNRYRLGDIQKELEEIKNYMKKMKTEEPKDKKFWNK